MFSGPMHPGDEPYRYEMFLIEYAKRLSGSEPFVCPEPLPVQTVSKEERDRAKKESLSITMPRDMVRQQYVTYYDDSPDEELREKHLRSIELSEFIHRVTGLTSFEDFVEPWECDDDSNDRPLKSSSHPHDSKNPKAILACTEWLSDGKVYDVEKIKALCGGDRIRAAPTFSPLIESPPTKKKNPMEGMD